MTLIKNILSFVFLISVASAMEQDAPEIFGDFKGLHAPFRDKNGDSNPYAHFSPLHGVNSQIVKNIRLHGHYGPEDKGFPRPNWAGKDSKKYPQDATASLLEILYPSYIGFLVDSRPSNPIHNWLKPQNIARIFNALQNPDFYDDPSAAVILLAKALQPEAFNKIEKEEKKRVLHNKKKQDMGNGPKYGPYSQLLSLTISKYTPSLELCFSEILFNAFAETANGKATKKGYPQHVVERILLTFMWEKKKTKTDLKPFYDTLSEEIINKSEMESIIWRGENACYNEKDYSSAKNLTDSTDPEIMILLKLGYPYFEDRFPPALSYGVSEVMVDGKTQSYSDCGETSLRNFFMMVLYDFETKKFDWTKLEGLNQKEFFNVLDALIDYFRNICPSPIHADTPKARNAWAKVLYGLKGVRYLYPTIETGTYAIAPGLDNMFTVIGILLGEPHWDGLTVRTDILDRLCTYMDLMNPGTGDQQALWKWEFGATSGKSSLTQGRELEPRREIEDPKDVSLLFKLEGKIIFEWIFEKEHFDFNRAEQSKNIPFQDWCFDSFNLPHELTKSLFPSFLYDGNLDSILGKFSACHHILWFQSTFKSSSFDNLLHRWIEPSGKYFGGWKDDHTNEQLIKLLLKYKTMDEVFHLKISELTAHMVWREVDADRPYNVTHIFILDRELYVSEGESFHNNEYEKMSRVMSMTLKRALKYNISTLVAAEADNYLWDVSGAGLLHLAVYAGYDLANELINNAYTAHLNSPTSEGYTPLHFAAQCVSREVSSLQELLKLGATVNEKDNEGNTPLHLAARSKAPTSFLKILLDGGADVNCLNMNDQSPLDFAFDALEKKESFYEGNIEYLIGCGANIHKEYRQGKTYLDWALSKNLSPHLIYILEWENQKAYIPVFILNGISYPERCQKPCFT